jgi:homopolymeric O-antigen transport system permease protein
LRLRAVWAYHELYFFVWRDLKVRYKQTVIGVAWVVLQPLCVHPVFQALAPWTYFSTALTTSSNVVVENQRVVSKAYFPRLILPLSK